MNEQKKETLTTYEYDIIRFCWTENLIYKAIPWVKLISILQIHGLVYIGWVNVNIYCKDDNCLLNHCLYTKAFNFKKSVACIYF